MTTAQCPLTARELDVVARLAAGRCTKQIATHLGITRPGLSMLLMRARSKTGAPTTTALVAQALRGRWIP